MIFFYNIAFFNVFFNQINEVLVSVKELLKKKTFGWCVW